MLKKILLLFVAAILGLSLFAACGVEINEENLRGTWEMKLYMDDYFQYVKRETGENPWGPLKNFHTGAYMPLRFTFCDGVAVLSVTREGAISIQGELCSDMEAYLLRQGIYELAAEEGYSREDFDEYLRSRRVTMAEIAKRTAETVTTGVGRSILDSLKESGLGSTDEEGNFFISYYYKLEGAHLFLSEEKDVFSEDDYVRISLKKESMTFQGYGASSSLPELIGSGAYLQRVDD